VTQNTRGFAEELAIDVRDFETYLAIREAAAQRLFHAAPWITARIRDAIGEYAHDMRVDTERLQELMGDMTNPAAVQEALANGAVELPITPGQIAALNRVEVLLALIEGWVETVTEAAHAGRVGSAVAIREALRRRRATGGPSERAFAQLMGLELRPRRLREAVAFWAAQSPESRDALWVHPDFLPDTFDTPNIES
jgi:putative hydrolase